MHIAKVSLVSRRQEKSLLKDESIWCSLRQPITLHRPQLGRSFLQAWSVWEEDFAKRLASNLLNLTLQLYPLLCYCKQLCFKLFSNLLLSLSFVLHMLAPSILLLTRCIVPRCKLFLHPLPNISLPLHLLTPRFVRFMLLLYVVHFSLPLSLPPRALILNVLLPILAL